MPNRRRTKAQVQALKAGLLQIAEQTQPLTLRSLFYRAVSEGLVGKVETEYKVIGRVAVEMRRDGQMPYDWLVDQGRFARAVSTWGNPGDILEAARRSYVLDRWKDQSRRVEVWCEKDAIVGVIEPITAKYLIPLYSCRGYPSLSLVHSAVNQWDGRPVSIRYYGDFDPSGVDIPRALKAELKDQDSQYVTIDFKVGATTPEQIEFYDLPTRPSKQTDSRAWRFEGESVELDAFDPRDLRNIVEADLEVLIQKEKWDESGHQEEKDQALLDTIVKEARRKARRDR